MDVEEEGLTSCSGLYVVEYRGDGMVNALLELCER